MLISQKKIHFFSNVNLNENKIKDTERRRHSSSLHQTIAFIAENISCWVRSLFFQVHRSLSWKVHDRHMHIAISLYVQFCTLYMYTWHWYTSYIYHRKSKLNNKYATIVRLTEENARDYETWKEKKSMLLSLWTYIGEKIWKCSVPLMMVIF